MPNLLSDHPSIVGKYIAELRDVNIQQDRMRFRRNLQRLSEIVGYEISKTLPFVEKLVETPLGQANVKVPEQRIVLATILRAGLPMQEGLLHVFDDADCAFISAYRRHHKDGSFEINLDYISCPNLDECTLILTDPMLATGASVKLVLETLLQHGNPANIHVVTAIASQYGVGQIRRFFPKVSLWVGALDDELTAKSLIVPGLGDAGDLAYGDKLQE
jgi:uracil phosphoribosyltransferase